MVFASRITIALSFLLFLFCFVPSIATGTSPLAQGNTGIISALLNTSLVERSLPIVARGICPSGYNMCNNGITCCPTMTFCIINDGEPRCCPVGWACINTELSCVDKDYVLCPLDVFCCPAGDTCSRDASQAPKCASGFIPGGVTTTQLPTPIPTTQSTKPLGATSSSEVVGTPPTTTPPTTTPPTTTPPTTTTNSAVESQASSSTVADSTSTTAAAGPRVTLGDGALTNIITFSSVLIMLVSIIAIYYW